MSIKSKENEKGINLLSACDYVDSHYYFSILLVYKYFIDR